MYIVNVGKYTIHEFYGYIEPCFGTPLGGKHVAMGEGTERKVCWLLLFFLAHGVDNINM